MWEEIKSSPVAVADMLDDLKHGNKFYTGVETDKGVLVFGRNYEGNHQYGAFILRSETTPALETSCPLI